MFDMDDTLYDYRSTLISDLARLRSPQEPPLPHDLWNGAPLWLKRRIDLIRNQPGWWLSLPKLKLGFDLYAVALEIGFTIELLTKGPRNNFTAWSEKAACAYRDFGRTVAVNIVGTTKRRTYARVLVDDYPPYALDWLKHRPRGLVIMPAHDYNAGISHTNIIRYDGTNLDRVAHALTIAFHRKSGEPLRLD